MNVSVNTYSQKILAQIVVQIFIAFRALMILPILARTLGGVSYGIWTQIVITVTLLAPVLTLCFETVFVRYFSSVRDKTTLRKAFSSMFFFMVLMILLFMSVFFVFPSWASEVLFKQSELFSFVYVLAGLLGSRAIFLFSLSYYRAQYQIGRYSFIQLIQILGEILVLFISIVIVKSELLEALYALTAYNFFIAAGTFGSVIKKIGLVLPDFHFLRPYLAYALPLVPNTSLQWVVNFSDRYFITHLMDLENVGIYAASYSLGFVITLFIAPIGFVLYPTMSRLWEEKKLDEMAFWMGNSLKYFLFFVIPSVLGVHYFAPFILSTLATEEFTGYPWLVLLVSSGFLFYGVAQIYIFLLLILEKTVCILLIFLIVAFVNIVLNSVLIPEMGITGAALATLISYFVQFGIVYLVTARRFRIPIQMHFIAKCFLSALVMFGILSFFKPESFLYHVLLGGLGVIVYIAFMVFLRGVGKKELGVLQETIRTFSLRMK